MPTTLKYTGTATRYFETAVTGRPVVWQPGRQQDVPDANVAALLATGNFQRLEDDTLAVAEIERIRAQSLRPKRWGVMGDSIAGQCSSVTSTTRYLNAKGFLPQLLMRLGFPASFEPEDNFAIAGANSSQMLDVGGQVDQIVASATASPIERMFISMGTNDPGNGLTYAQTISNLANIFRRLRDAGMIPVYTCVLPRGNDGAITTAKRTNMAVNSWAHEFAAANSWMEVIDCGVYLANGANAFGNILTAHADGSFLHPNDTGAELMAVAMEEYYVQRGLGRLWRPLTQRGDVYDATNNPWGVCFEGASPFLTGTGGALAGGATGQVPDGHTGTAGTWSKGSITLPNGATRDTAIVAVGSSLAHHLYDDATATGAWATEGPLPGDRIYAAARVRLQNTASVTQFKLTLAESDGSGTTQTAECGNQDSTTPGKLNVGATAKEFWLITPTLTVRPYSGGGNCSMYARMQITTGAAAAGSMEVLEMVMRKRPTVS